jgi:hypothetical protein
LIGDLNVIVMQVQQVLHLHVEMVRILDFYSENRVEHGAISLT